MGTFHQGKSELHGITVVVDTTGPEIFVGRCDDEDDRGIFLDDADVHRDGDGGRSKDDYVRRAAQLGVAGAGWCLLAGSAIFSGTVFGLAVGGPRWLGAITPIGGSLLIVGFLIFAWAALRG